MLTMDGIEIVHQEGAVGTFETYLVGPEDGLQQPREEPDADHHDDHREQPAARPFQRDVAETSRGEGDDGEVERVDVARDPGVDVVLRDIDDRRHDEDEDAENCRALGGQG